MGAKLGQHFLNSPTAVQAAIKAADLKAGEMVLEIGPGKGFLTDKLLAAGAQVVAVEKDSELIQFLYEKYQEETAAGQLQIIEKDVLEFKPETTFVAGENYKLVANIPYYITGAIIRQFLTADLKPKLAVLLMQKEVAQRVVAQENKGRRTESLLSISVKAYGKPKMVQKVPARYFSPPPKVDSAILLIDEISNDFFARNQIDETRFFEIVRAGFSHKRKRLINNLAQITPKEVAEAALAPLDMVEARAENLSLNDWLAVYRSLVAQT